MSYDVGNPAFDCCRELESLRKSARTLEGEIERLKETTVPICQSCGKQREMVPEPGAGDE